MYFTLRSWSKSGYIKQCLKLILGVKKKKQKSDGGHKVKEGTVGVETDLNETIIQIPMDYYYDYDSMVSKPFISLNEATDELSGEVKKPVIPKMPVAEDTDLKEYPMPPSLLTLQYTSCI